MVIKTIAFITMDQHPIPRQITSFEFKLIGFMTLRQFIFLIIFIPLGFVTYYLFPIPVINILFGVMVGSLGIFFAFFPIYDRPLDLWIRDLYKRLTRPTQYSYHKKNRPLYFLDNLFFVSDPHRVASHIESQEKLAAYLAQVKKTPTRSNVDDKKKQALKSLFNKPLKPIGTKEQNNRIVNKTTSTKTVGITSSKKSAFFSGIVKNHKLIALPGILIYVKDGENKTLRLLKTNPHGVFATFNPLLPGDYMFELKDPNNNYFFDTMKIKIDSVNERPLEFFSKELI